jgi:hypothetical protein
VFPAKGSWAHRNGSSSTGRSNIGWRVLPPHLGDLGRHRRGRRPDLVLRGQGVLTAATSRFAPGSAANPFRGRPGPSAGRYAGPDVC